MSKQVDERVVSMQFDNKNFEKNVSTTMSTLDKFKQKLNLSGASKGLENVNSAAKKVDMNGLAKGVETVNAKFSALQVMGVTALANITNSAVNAGKNIIKAFTIDPVKTGFNEYELKMNSVQTIMASTGADIETVNKYLNELNEYSDKTIYSFSDMTESIGKFTNAGVNLDDAVLAIKGISNEAAVSGANANEASRAMYNFAQALSAGYVKLIDWKSIENANMATVEFKQQLIDTAVEVGTLTKTTEGYVTTSGTVITATQNFNDSLQDQWMTTDVLVGTLKDYADETTEIGKKAYASAQDVKTFSMMMDTLKETAQSGWAQTWEIIFGDLNKAKELWTGLTNFFGKFIDKMSDARNKLLEGAFGKTFKSLSEKISGALKPVKETAKAVETVTNTVKDYGKVVDEILNGAWGNGQSRWNKLTEAGYDWAHAQNLVNEKLGDSTRHATEYKEVQDALNKSQEQSVETQKELSKTDAKRIEELALMSEKQLKSLGYTDEQIKAFKELRETAEKLGMPLSEFIQKMDEIDGRWLFLNSFKNIGQSIVKIFESIGKAWKEVFPPMTSNQLFNIIAGFHKLSTKLKISDKTADNLKRTFKGLFSILHIVSTLVGGPVKIAFKIFTKILDSFHLDIWDVTAAVGDAIVRFDKWLDKTLDFTKIFEKITPYIKKAISAIKEWASAIKDSDFFKTGINVIQGLIEGIKSGSKKVLETMLNLGKMLLEKIKGVLGIHSPSTKMKEVGENIIEGLIQGIQNGVSKIWEVVSKIGEGIVKILKAIPWGSLFAGGISIGMLYTINKVTDTIGKLAAPLEGINNFLTDIGNGLKTKFKAQALEAKSKALLNLAISIGILAASVYVLSKIDAATLWSTVGAITVLGAVMVALLVAMDKLSATSSGKFDFKKTTKLLLSMIVISGSLLLMAAAIKKLSTIELKDVPTVLITFGAAIAGMIGMLYAIGKLTKGSIGANIDKAGIVLLKMSVTLLIMVYVIKQMAKLEGGVIAKGLGVIALVELLFIAVIAVSKLAGKNADKAGKMLLQMSVAFLIMVHVIKQASKLDGEQIAKGIGVMAALEVLFTAAILISKLAGKEGSKAGKMLLQMSGAFLIMALVIRIVGEMSIGSIVKGLVVITVLETLFAALIAVSYFAGKNATKAGLMLLAMSGALLILTGVMFIISLLDPGDIAKSLGVITVLEALFAGLIYITKYAQSCQKTLITLLVAVSILIASLVALTFIDPAKLATASASLTAVIGVFALLIYATQFLKTGEKTWKRNLATIGVLTAVVAALSGVLIALANIKNPDSLLPAAESLSLLLITLSASLALLGNSKTMSKEKLVRSMSALGIMTGVIALLGGILAALSFLPNPNTLIPSAIALSTLIIALTGSLVVLSLIGKSAKNAYSGILALTAMVVPLATFAAALAYLPIEQLEGKEKGIIILTAVMAAMSLLLLALTGIGALIMATGGIGPVAGILGLLAMVAPLVIFANVIQTLPDVSGKIGTVKTLTELMVAMTDCLFKVSILGPLALIGVTAITALGLVIGAFAIVATAIGALMEKFPALETFVDKGIVVLIKLANGLGQMIGAFIGGVAEGIVNCLPPIGLALSQFMVNVMPFINGAKLVDETVAKGVAILVGAILALTVADFITGITSLLPFSSGLPGLGTQLSSFMANATPFLLGAKAIGPEVMEGIKSLAEAILIITGANLVQSIVSFLGGGSSMDKFGTELSSLGKGLNNFITSLGPLTDDQVSIAGRAANIIKTLAQAASEIPNSGGWIGAIVGDNDMGPWAEQLPLMAKGIADFTNTLTEANLTEDSVKIANNAAKIIKSLAQAASEIPNAGGLLAGIVGDNDFGTWATQLPNVASGIAGFTTKLSEAGVTEDSVNIANNAAKIVKTLASASSEIPNAGGLLASIIGDNDFSTWATQLPNVGKGIAGFANELGTFDESKMATVNCAVKAIKVIADMSKDYGAVKDFGDFTSFGNGMITLATKVKDFADKMGEISEESINTAKKTINAVIEIAKTVSKVDTGPIKTFGDNMKKAGGEGIKKFISSLNSKDAKDKGKKAINDLVTACSNAAKSSGNKDKFKKAGNSLVKSCTNAIKSDDNKEKAKTACNSLVKSCANAIKSEDNKSKMSGAGKDLVNGLINGLKNKDKLQEVYDAGFALGQKAVQGEKDGQQSNSPSKLTTKAGKWLGEGLIIGMGKMMNPVYKSGNSLGETASNSISSAISKVYELMNNDFDAQPTIRPVLDLSDVQSGANTISGLFSGNRILSISAPGVGAISASMAKRQNGNYDLTSAINKLAKSNSGKSGNTYNINGITYDDGSEVSDAIKTLVRAVKIEGRT